MPVTTTDLNPVLKELYKGQRMKDLTKKDHPFFGRLQNKAQKGFGGKGYPVPVKSGGPQGISSVFATAQANQSSARYKEFMLTRVKKYGVASIEQEAMKAASDDAEAFINSQADLLDNLMERTGDSIATDLYGNGKGSITTISSISTGVITLTDPDAARAFERDMKLQALSSSDEDTLETGSGYVIAVNRRSGTVTVSTSLGGSAGTPTGWSAGDYLIRDGDRNATVKGVQAWLPATAPSSGDSFCAVDRSEDSRLYGCYVDASAGGMTIIEGINAGLSQTLREGGKPRDLFIGYSLATRLQNSLQGQVIRPVEAKAEDAAIAFAGFEIMSKIGPVKVWPDADCPPGKGFLLEMDSWGLYALGDVPYLFDEGTDQVLLRSATADAYEMRVGMFGNLGCNAPGHNCHINFGV